MTDAERAKDAMPLPCNCGQGFTAAGPVVCSVHERIAAALAAAERRGMERAAKIAEKEAAIGVPFTIEGASYSATCRIVADAIRAAAKEGA